MTTTSINDYIKNLIFEQMNWYDLRNFERDFEDALYELFNNSDDNWNNFTKPTLDEFMAIQNDVYDYLDDMDSLNYLTSEKRNDWKWYCNLYALSREWLEVSTDVFKYECFDWCHCNAIINFQSNVRRRQATIKIIKQLHVTGTL